MEVQRPVRTSLHLLKALHPERFRLQHDSTTWKCVKHTSQSAGHTLEEQQPVRTSLHLLKALHPEMPMAQLMHLVRLAVSPDAEDGDADGEGDEDHEVADYLRTFSSPTYIHQIILGMPMSMAQLAYLVRLAMSPDGDGEDDSGDTELATDVEVEWCHQCILKRLSNQQRDVAAHVPGASSRVAQRRGGQRNWRRGDCQRRRGVW